MATGLINFHLWLWTKARPPDPPQATADDKKDEKKTDVEDEKKPDVDDDVVRVDDDEEEVDDEMLKHQTLQFQKQAHDPVMCLDCSNECCLICPIWFALYCSQSFESSRLTLLIVLSQLADQSKELRLEVLEDFGVDMRTTILFFSLSERFGFLGRCRQSRLLRLASIVNALLSSVQFINCCCQVLSIVAVKCSIHQLKFIESEWTFVCCKTVSRFIVIPGCSQPRNKLLFRLDKTSADNCWWLQLAVSVFDSNYL